MRVGVGGERTARASVVHLTHVRARAKTAVFAPSFLTDANWVVVACDTRVFAWRACVHLWPATLPCTGGQAEAAETRSYAERFPPYQPVSLKNDKGIGSLRKKAGDIDRDPKGVRLRCCPRLCCCPRLSCFPLPLSLLPLSLCWAASVRATPLCLRAFFPLVCLARAVARRVRVGHSAHARYMAASLHRCFAASAFTRTGEAGELSWLEKKERAKQQSHMHWILSMIEQGDENEIKPAPHHAYSHHKVPLAGMRPTHVLLLPCLCTRHCARGGTCIDRDKADRAKRGRAAMLQGAAARPQGVTLCHTQSVSHSQTECVTQSVRQTECVTQCDTLCVEECVSVGRPCTGRMAVALIAVACTTGSYRASQQHQAGGHGLEKRRRPSATLRARTACSCDNVNTMLL